MGNTFDSIDASFDTSDWGFDSEPSANNDGFDAHWYLQETYNPYRKRKTREELIREEMEAAELYFRYLHGNR